MDRGPISMNHRTASILLLVAATLLIFSACRKATFEENYRQGLEEMKEGKYPRARVRLQRARLQSPNNIETKYQLALVELKLKDPRTAFSLLHEAEEKDRKESSVSVPIRIELAKLYFGSRRYDEAQRRLLWVLEKQPHNKEARSLLSVDLLYLDEPEAAREQVDLLLAEDPENRNGRAVDVVLHLVNREAQAGEASLLEEINLTHRSTDSLMTLARFYRLLGAPGKALPLLQEVLQHDPKNTPLRLQLGWSYAQAGDSANAEKTFREMAQVAPADRTAVMALANYYLNLGDWPKAVAELERLIKQSPDANSRDLLAAAYYRDRKSVV